MSCLSILVKRLVLDSSALDKTCCITICYLFGKVKGYWYMIMFLGLDHIAFRGVFKDLSVVEHIWAF